MALECAYISLRKKSLENRDCTAKSESNRLSLVPSWKMAFNRSKRGRYVRAFRDSGRDVCGAGFAPQNLSGGRKKQRAIGTYNSIVSGSRDEFQNERTSTVFMSSSTV